MAGSNAVAAAAALVAVVAILSFATVSAQDLAPGSAPAPAPEVGSGFSVGASSAVICSSLLLSLLAFLKN